MIVVLPPWQVGLIASHRVATSVLPKLLAMKGLNELSRGMAEEVFTLLGSFRPPPLRPHRPPPLPNGAGRASPSQAPEPTSPSAAPKRDAVTGTPSASPS